MRLKGGRAQNARGNETDHFSIRVPNIAARSNLVGGLFLCPLVRKMKTCQMSIWGFGPFFLWGQNPFD